MTILSKFEFGVLRLSIDHPMKRNAINADMFDALTEALVQASQDESVRVVLMQGGEQIFSAGADLEQMRSAPEILDQAMVRFFEVIKNFKKPIVAQVNGPCVGEAFTMLLYCDLVYASDKALFSIPSVALGRTTRFGAALMMATSAGIVRAAEKLMLSEPISANEALDMRLITGIADEDSLDQLVASKVARLAVLPPQAVQATKTLLTLSRNQLLNILTDDEEAIWHRQNLSEEAKEALAAFLEGRKPSFRSE